MFALCGSVRSRRENGTGYKSPSYELPLKPIRIQFRNAPLSNPSISPLSLLRLVIPSRRGQGPGNSGDKSRATPFKSREAYVKCTRDNRLRCVPRSPPDVFIRQPVFPWNTRTKSEDVYVNALLSKSVKPADRFPPPRLSWQYRARWSLLFIHTAVLLSVCTNGIHDEWYWSRQNSPSCIRKTRMR